jgi:hypothetical protein
VDAEVMSAVTAGFTSLAGMVKSVVIIGVPSVIGIIGLTSGAKYGIKWVRGMINKAAA